MCVVLCQTLSLTRPTQAKVKASGYSPPLRTMRCMLSSCSLMCRWSCTRHNAAHSQLELELDTVARFLRCRSTELKVLATGRSPPPRGESLGQPIWPCGPQLRELRAGWSRGSKLPVATSSRKACGPRAPCAGAVVRPSECEPQRESRAPVASSSPLASQLSFIGGKRAYMSSRNSNFVRVFVFPPEAHCCYCKKRTKRKPLRARLPAVVII